MNLQEDIPVPALAAACLAGGAAIHHTAARPA